MDKFDPISYINEPRWRHTRPGLERIRELLLRLGNPHLSLSFVHVAGTNGKGSTCAYVARILRSAGYKTGIFTSPFIIDFCERIQINNENIPIDKLTSVTLSVKKHVDSMVRDGWDHPTEFELMTAVAFEYFFQEECDFVVCEVGLGGRLDSTNIIERPEVSVITNIGFDHVSFLGDSLTAIAQEKAGIIKEHRPCVCYCFEEKETVEVLRAFSKKQSAPLFELNKNDVVDKGIQDDNMRHFIYQGQDYQTRILGSYQVYNAALAIQAASIMKSRGWNISNCSIVEGIKKTQWPYRFQCESMFGRMIIIDGAHNEQGAKALVDSIKDSFPCKRILFIVSVLADKDYLKMVELFCQCSHEFICVTADNDRALSAGKLSLVIKDAISRVLLDNSSSRRELVVEAASFSDAIQRARRMTSPSDVICICGSLYSIRSAKAALQEEMHVYRNESI